MKEITIYQEFKVYKLTRALAKEFIADIVIALDLIPQADKHTATEVLADKRGERVFYAKWDHSFVMLNDGGDFVAVIIGYERESENNNQYPDNCIYLSELAVAAKFQKRGIGKFLCQLWIDYNKRIGFQMLKGDLKFCVQTNNSDWNIHVQRLYESFGFQKTGKKQYGKRTDNIYSIT